MMFAGPIHQSHQTPYHSVLGRIGGFTEDFRLHLNGMCLQGIPLHTLWDIVDIRLSPKSFQWLIQGDAGRD